MPTRLRFLTPSLPPTRQGDEEPTLCELTLNDFWDKARLVVWRALDCQKLRRVYVRRQKDSKLDKVPPPAPPRLR